MASKLDTYVLDEDRLYLINGAGQNLSKRLVDRTFTMHLHSTCQECTRQEPPRWHQDEVAAGVVVRFERGICAKVIAMMQVDNAIESDGMSLTAA